jgi:hypothetical protein
MSVGEGLLEQGHDQGLFHLAGVEAEGTTAGLEGDLAFTVDDVEAVGDAAVQVADAVVDGVNQERDARLQVQGTGLCGGDSAGVVSRLKNLDTGFVIRFHPPAVDRMCLAHVDADELRLALVAPGQRFEGPKLGPERPSSETSEDEHHRMLASELAEGDRALAILSGQCEVGGELT